MGDEKPARRVGSATAPQNSADQDAESKYRREIRDLELLIKILKRKQEDLAEQPPTEEETSEITNAIDSGAYVSKEIEIGVQIRDMEKKLESAKKRLQFLFETP